MPDDYRIIDADGHVQEMDDHLAEYIGPPRIWHGNPQRFYRLDRLPDTSGVLRPAVSAGRAGAE